MWLARRGPTKTARLHETSRKDSVREPRGTCSVARTLWKQLRRMVQNGGCRKEEKEEHIKLFGQYGKQLTRSEAAKFCFDVCLGLFREHSLCLNIRLKSHLTRTQSLKDLPEKPRVGQHIAMHATLTARNFFLANFYTSGPFICIFPKPLLSFTCVSCG